MEYVLALVVGVLFASGVYLTLRRSLLRLLVGFVLLSHATNLLVFTAAGLTRKHAPLIPAGETLPPEPFADPLPQAMVLTAMVISFGVIAFGVALVYRTYRTTKTDDVDELTTTES